MDKVADFYKLIEPIANLIEENKEKIDSLISGIEDDITTPLEDWMIVEDLEHGMLNLTFSGGDTALRELKELMEGN